jgi:Tfp pilus assembly protein PilN
MIRINLLPEEYRRQKRTSFGLLLAITGAVALNGLLVAWYAWLAFGVQAEIESERAVLQTELDGLQPQVEYHKSLDGEQKRFAGRETTLAGITKSRISWTRKLDELCNVVNAGGDGKRHFVWFDDLGVTQSLDPRAKTAGTFKAAGHSGSEKFEQVANFLDDLEHSPFIQDFERLAPPEGSQSQVDEELIPPVVWAFPLSLTLKGPVEPAKPAAKPKPAQVAQPAVEAKQ